MPFRPRLGHSFSRMLGVLLVPMLSAPPSIVLGEASDVEELEQRVANLASQLAAAQRSLEAARAGRIEDRVADDAVVSREMVAPGVVAETDQALDESAPESTVFKIGPVTIGGAMRVNYVLGSYKIPEINPGPNRGGRGGNIELDTFRINLALDYDNLIGRLEYRWYTAGSGKSYNFLHTGWLGYRFADDSEIQLGVNRVPFGPGPYGVSQSWFFDQHYYVGLSDDMDLGIKYSTTIDRWLLDVAYYPMSEGSYFGRSLNSTRYSYDAVRWRETVDADGNVSFGVENNGYDERHQFNVRAIYQFDDTAVPTDLGVSLQYGRLKGQRANNGSHWAASVHMVNRIDQFTLASQLTRYEYDIDSDNPWGTAALIPMGAYDFAWPVASKAWIPAISISYLKETPQIPWLDSVLPYLEYSSIVKDESSFNDSQLWVAGAAWASGGWYIYSDFAYSNGNYFVGNRAAGGGMDDYSRIDGVGDFGVNGNDKWNYRFNLNLGYYF
ncbi:hypothetical protein CKO25_02965 [Thiocapsa imhoffii]|uniref:Carbohydrate porin n=2 Tax=Thiocapsa imhoffii TaxID=382777 RepID=A0A9X0WFH9_9GAMM|nr:hypothetical protein [Thiocapsa imhoffii]